MFVQQLTDFYGRLLIRKHMIGLGNVTETDHGISSELGVVGSKKDLVGVGDDCLSDSDFAVIEVEEGTIIVNTADSNDAEVHLELIDEVHGSFTDNSAITVAHLSASDDYMEIFFGRKNGRNVQVVGNYL